MVQLALLVALLAALVLAAGTTGPPVADPVRTLVGTGLLVGALAFLAIGGARTLTTRLHYEPQDHRDCRRWLARLENVHFVLWALASVAILYGLEWPRWVRVNGGLAGWLLLDELLVLAPILLPPAVAWAAGYDVELALARAAERAAGVPCELPQAWWERLGLRLAYVWHQARLAVGLVLLPALVLVLLHDLAETLAPGLSQSPWAAAIYLPPVVLGIVGVPLWFRLLWPTRPLASGALRARLETAAAQAGLPVGEILVWETHGTQANAAILGYAPPLRYVLLTDLLLELLDDDEIEAVFRHELAHLTGGHLWIRLAVLAAPLALVGLAQAVWPGGGLLAERAVVQAGLEPHLAATLLWPALLCGYCAVALGWCSRALEHDADLASCALAHEADPRPAGAEIAAFRLGRALVRLHEATGGDPRAASWLHPSLDDRLAVLAGAAEDASCGQAGLWRVRWLLLVVYGLAAAVGGAVWLSA